MENFYGEYGAGKTLTEQQANSVNYLKQQGNSNYLRDIKNNKNTQVAIDTATVNNLLSEMAKASMSTDRLLEKMDKYLNNPMTTGEGVGEKGAYTEAINRLNKSIEVSTAVREEGNNRIAQYEEQIIKIDDRLSQLDVSDSSQLDERTSLMQERTRVTEEKRNLQRGIADIDQDISDKLKALEEVNKIKDTYEERERENIDKYGWTEGKYRTFRQDLSATVTESAASALDLAKDGKWENVAEIVLPAALAAMGVAIPLALLGSVIKGAVDLFTGGGLGNLLGGLGSGAFGDIISGALNGVSDIVKFISDKLDSSVDDAVEIYSENMGKVNSRLLGDADGVTFAKILDDVRSTIGSSMLVDERQLINQIVNLSQQGINYNLEQRALLQTLSEDLVPTFSALDGTLTRLVRIQQADLTLSQMGTEAKLLEFLNNQYQDTSYLNDVYDNVTSALTDVLSTQLDTDQMTQFGYAVQKWMGALYSVGVSSQAISSFADAINSLGTGDINKLGDSASNTLMAMVANRAGLSYASLLTEGLTADTTNELMKAMVEILQDIANNTSSNVVKSQWGDILNIEMSDWRALQNLTNEDISNLYNSIVTQQDAETHVSSLIEEFLPQNIHISEQINNALNNTMLGFGLGIANDPEKYAQWKLLSIANNITGDLGGQYLGAITNLLTEGATFARFSEDILNIPRQLMSLLVSGDNGIGTLMSGYQSQMTRGGMNINSETNISESSDTVKISNDLANTFLNSLGIEENNGNLSFINSDYDDIVSTSADDYAVTTFQQQDQYVSATAQNIISQDSAVIRDINDLYAELFERQTTPIRVALAKLEDEAKLNIHEAIEGSNVIVSGEVSVEGDVFDSLYSMRG